MESNERFSYGKWNLFKFGLLLIGYTWNKDLSKKPGNLLLLCKQLFINCKHSWGPNQTKTLIQFLKLQHLIAKPFKIFRDGGASDHYSVLQGFIRKGSRGLSQSKTKIKIFTQFSRGIYIFRGIYKVEFPGGNGFFFSFFSGG